MCKIGPQIHRIVQKAKDEYSVQRYNHATNEYETIHDKLSEISAKEIKSELDADLQG